ncbi:response regulator [Christiangramia sediminis]|uniref:Response regulator n=1 Tax=Christiangramia sediminis TaxID=2881336 RepID=A0A9X1LII6_9FLAO|nr:response regulator [Christiangramia sediminis]MCB7481031.1 response regulator [Christiangramia sediminis]
MKKIFIIEDDLVLLDNTAELLELEGYQVAKASTGRKGIMGVKEFLPDLIICDIMMPEVDGYEVLEAVSLDFSTSHIPFIFISAKTEYVDIRKGMQMGADDYLTKPFEEEDLLKAIKSRITKSESLTKIFSEKRNSTTENGNSVRNLSELKNFFEMRGEILNYNESELVYSEGEHTNRIYLILKGVVKSFKINKAGKELTTALHKKDEFLGLTSFIENNAYHESAVVVQPVELAAISKNILKEILNNNQHVCFEFMDLMNKNILEVHEQLLHLVYSSVYSKTAQTLIDFSTTLSKNPTQAFKIRRSDLASAAGIATESLIRTLSSFRKDGLIEIEGHSIKILDLNGLKQINI